jgi:hypothetical protein
MNPVHHSRAFFFLRCNSAGLIIDCNRYFKDTFPWADCIADFIAAEDAGKIPHLAPSSGSGFKPVDLILTIRFSDGLVKSLWHFSSIDSLVFTAIGNAITERSLSDEETFERIRALQSHQVRAPIASLMGLIGALDGNTDPDEQQQIFRMIEKQINCYDDVIRKIIIEAT